MTVTQTALLAVVFAAVMVVGKLTSSSGMVNGPVPSATCSPFNVAGSMVSPSAWPETTGIQKDIHSGHAIFFIFSFCKAVKATSYPTNISEASYIFVNPYNHASGIPPLSFDTLQKFNYSADDQMLSLQYGSNTPHHLNDHALVTISCGGSTLSPSFAGPYFTPEHNSAGGLTGVFKFKSLALCSSPQPPSTPQPSSEPATPTPAAWVPPTNGTTRTVLDGQMTLEFVYIPTSDRIRWTFTSPAKYGRYFAVARSPQGMANGTGIACEQPGADSSGPQCSCISTFEWGVNHRVDTTTKIISYSRNDTVASVTVELSASAMQISAGIERIIYAVGNWDAARSLPFPHAVNGKNFNDFQF